MDSWENLILQWINCLYGDKYNYIKSTNEFEDEKIYYNLIEKIKPWNQKDHTDGKKKIINHFIKDEYPNIVFNENKSSIENIYTAILILSRLSLEPIFHKSLCINLPVDTQVKIKYILESVYKLGKDITIEHVCKIMSIANKSNIKHDIKPKYMLEKFLNSPVIQSVHIDNKIHEQTKQLRTLKAKVETLHYEKSELIEDIKIQQNQIQELQKKLQEALSNMKIPFDNNFKVNFNCSCQVQNIKLIESTYKKELQSIEKYVIELRNDNLQLQEEKNYLMNEVKICKTNICMLEEKNIKNNQILELTTLQAVKKEEDFIELRIKYDELYSYLKDKYKICIYNESFDLDDKEIHNRSLNKSETLSSVIEIQLQDTKKELMVIKNKFKIVDVLLTIIMEEYKKLKGKVDILYMYNIKFNQENILYPEQYNSIKNQTTINKLNNDYDSVQNEIKILFTKIYKNNLLKFNNNSLFLELLNIFDYGKNIKSFKKFIIFKVNKDITYTINLLNKNNNSTKITKILEKFTNLNKVKIFQKDNNLKINFNNKEVIKFCEIFGIKTWHNQTVYFTILSNKIIESTVILKENYTINNLPFNIINLNDQIHVKNYIKLLDIINNFEINLKILNKKEFCVKSNIQNNYKFNFVIYTLLTHKKINCIYIILNRIINNKITCLQYNQTSKFRKLGLLTKQYNIKSFKSTWIFLFESIHDNVKIHKVLLLLEKNWFFTLEIFKNIILCKSYIKLKLKQLLIKKSFIETELRNIYLENLRIYSITFIIIVQFICMLSKNCYNEIKLCEDKLLSNINLKHKIGIVKKQIDIFNILLKSYKQKILIYNASKIIEKKNDKNTNILIDLNKNKSIKFKNENIGSKDNNSNNNQEFQYYIKEVHEQYELKLEKMKEKMKFVYNNQINIMKKEQEIIAKTQLEALESKIKYQFYNHTEELKKYKKHITELTKQLWHVGDKLINEKQEKEAMIRKFEDLKMNYGNSKIKNREFNDHKLQNYKNFVIKLEANHNAMKSLENNSIRDFQIMGNAFSNEDEEGEVFDPIYISDTQKSQFCTQDSNRLSILQMRNAKCKPHLKSSYSAELQFYPTSFTEDEIKTGPASEDLFNDSLSQSLLTGKKVKRKDRTRNIIDTPQRSRRFSNIFRKHRLSMDRK